jgi:hypothetical protein
MKRLLLTLATLLAATAASPLSAQAAFGVNGFDVVFTNEDGTMTSQAGSHPDAATFDVGFNIKGVEPNEEAIPEGWVRDFAIEQIPGLVADTTAYPRCKSADFLNIISGISACPLETQVGITSTSASFPGSWGTSAVFNLNPPPGTLMRFGFTVGPARIVVDTVISPEPPYLPVTATRNTPQLLNLVASKTQIWGNPSDPAHDELRGLCGLWEVNLPSDEIDAFQFESPNGTTCPVPPRPKPLLTLPTSCSEPLRSGYEILSWEGDSENGGALTHDEDGNPQPLTGCGKLNFSPTFSARPTTTLAETGSGLDIGVEFNDEGLTSVSGLAESQAEKAVLTLPEGMTINPSAAEGLGVCTPADLARESATSAPGDGCPNSSKLGTLSVRSPLVDQSVEGSLYLAQQDDPATAAPGAENPFDSLIALYFVLQNKALGISVKLPVKIEPDPLTGRLRSILEDIPQLPFSSFKVHLREGQRAALITPPTCGAHEAVLELTPRSDPQSPHPSTSSFQLEGGVGGGPCPPGGVPPFEPGYEAGSLNNNAGSFSPFNERLTRRDGEQNMTRFSSVLPPGVLGKLAGVDKCPDAAIEATKAKTGREELASPSCPPNSLIGHTLAGAGVGGALTYVPGQLYLGGPYRGAPLSVVSVTPAVAGPFDAGTVVVREALSLNPNTAEVIVDGANSDPIPHILKGIVLKVRDLQVYVDRPNFTLNPTSCEESSAKATLFGSFLNVLSPLDDVPVELATRYQAANCVNLGFKPSLKLNLRGGTKRGGHPSLKAVLRARPGDANIAASRVTLPRSAFLDQAHIRTICTRVQFAAENCPPGSIYGHAKAITPLLDEPLEGPVILRSSDNKLPDLVVALKGLVDVNIASRIDSFKGGIRNTFDVVPDAPVSSFTLTLQGGKKGLVVNSRDLCAGRTSRVKARFSGQNGRVANLRPKLEPQCGGGGRK